MFCAQCGSRNDDNAYRCTACGVVLARSGELVPTIATGVELGPSPSYLGPAILVTIMCCLPAGVPAIVYAALAMGKNASGDFVAARKYSRNAQVWTWVSFGVGLVVIAIYVLAGGVAQAP